jgi:hypothetical protein
LQQTIDTKHASRSNGFGRAVGERAQGQDVEVREDFVDLRGLTELEKEGAFKSVQLAVFSLPKFAA